MLASFTSMLPSGIGFSRDDRERERQDKERERERAPETAEEETPRANDNDGKMKENIVDEHGVKKRRERNPNETFIVVRPPPSVSNHPLNLQLQLVPPQAKDRSASGASTASGLSRPSVDAFEETGDSVSRAQSVRSNRSDAASFYASSSASVSSIASNASTASTSSRRMIVPLYNLSAHNVMTNTVLDAGTDAKVAKLHKRGMEILALAVLECVEVWPSFGRSGPGHVAFLNANTSTNGANSGPGGPGGSALDHDVLLVTPTSSAISLSSTGSHPPHPHVHPHPASHPYMQSSAGGGGTPKAPRPTSSSGYGNPSANVTPTTSPSASGAKRIFGKIFKKRESQSPDAAITVVPPTTESGSLQRSGSIPFDASDAGHGSRTGTGLSIRSASKRRSIITSSPTPSHLAASPVTSASGERGGREQPQLQPAILGIQPTLSAPVVPPAGRPTRYIWIVRKWLKGGESGLLGGVKRGVSMVGAGIGGISGISGSGGNLNSPSGQGQFQGQAGSEVGVEVRFEWARGQSKSQEKRRARRSVAQAARGSTSFSQEDAAGLQPRRSLVVDRSAERKQLEKSRSRGRGARPATSSGAGSGTPRVSIDSEPRRSAEHTTTSHDSRTNSLTSGLSEEALRVVGEDDGEESDPEDSETPWTCTLVVSSMVSTASRLWENEYLERDGQLGHGLAKKDSRRSGLSHTQEGSSTGESFHNPSASPNPNQVPPPPPPKPRAEAPGTLLKLKVGALSPAPHHPKVVAQLKVPYPLPDVEVTRGKVRRRVLTPAGVARPVARAETFGSNFTPERDERDRPRSRGMFGNTGSGIFGNSGNGGGGEPEGLVLTAEEIKDVLSCTAFWVVVREGFGGVGRVNRKGDGWRIRG